MFYSDIFTYEDKQKILKLVDDRLISTHVPEFMKGSQHVLTVKRVEMRSSSRINAEHSLIPCINPAIPLQLLGSMLRGELNGTRERLAVLFELGLGVPKQPDVAAYIRAYDQEDDSDGAALRSIRKLVIQYQDMIETQFSDLDRMYPAAYMARLLDFNSFVGQGDADTSVRVPVGIPTLLVYYTSDHTVGQFKLVDAFDCRGGLLSPFAHIALRRDTQIPEFLNSPNLARASSYALVFGVLAGGEDLTSFINTVGRDELDIVLACNPELISEEFAEEIRNSRPDARDSKVRRAAIKFGKESVLAKAEFIAVDVGFISRRGQIRANSSPLAKTSRILKNIGFETKAKTVNKMQTFRYGGSPRVWNLEEVK